MTTTAATTSTTEKLWILPFRLRDILPELCVGSGHRYQVSLSSPNRWLSRSISSNLELTARVVKVTIWGYALIGIKKVKLSEREPLLFEIPSKRKTIIWGVLGRAWWRHICWVSQWSLSRENCKHAFAHEPSVTSCDTNGKEHWSKHWSK